ncbi:MAG: methylenetetrahydrofolate reductase [Chitinophagaceae bacterium]
MKITEYISKAGSTLLSYEILPPLKGKDIGSIYNHLDPLMEFKPSWINVTYHRTEAVFKKRANGAIEKTKMRKRPGTVGICAALKNHYGVDTVPHIICGGFSKNDTEDALIDLNFLGIDNILALRGDAAKSDGIFIPEPDGHRYALDLVRQVANLNKGIYLEDGEVTDGIATDFCIGVAGYPEKHFEASNIADDLAFLKAKVDAGAQYIMTQMFFDNQKFFGFVKNCRDLGINVPIIPGLKPLTRKKQLSILPKIFNVQIPKDLADALLQTDNDADAEKVGTEWLIQQSRELRAFGVPVLHYYTLGKPETIRNVVKELF